jgi:hypothetical protein
MSTHEIHALSGAYAVDALDADERARFEQRYLREVAAEYATFELFQAVTGPARHKFSALYSPPSVARRQRLDADTEDGRWCWSTGSTRCRANSGPRCGGGWSG